MSKRAVLRLVGAMTAGLVALSVLVLPARAGGPTSVLMVNASTGKTGALYYTDADYDALAAAVGWYGGDNQPMETTRPQEGSFGSQVRLTWLIHDVSIWRIDRIHLDAEGGWLVETLVDLDDGNLEGATPVWHRPADPTRLEALLRTGGVIGRGAVKPATPLNPADTGPADTGPADTRPADTGAADTGAAGPGSAATPLDWWPALAAGLAGLVLGIGGTLVAHRLRRRPGPPSAPQPEAERVVLTG